MDGVVRNPESVQVPYQRQSRRATRPTREFAAGSSARPEIRREREKVAAVLSRAGRNRCQATTLTTVTCRDYHLVMTDVRIADLKARLSEHLRSVRNGTTLTVLDRNTPVARIVPYAQQPLEIRKAKRRARELKLPPKPAKRTDSAAILIEDRRRR